MSFQLFRIAHHELNLIIEETLLEGLLHAHPQHRLVYVQAGHFEVGLEVVTR